MHFRWTIQELKEWSNKELIKAFLRERKSSCTNMYSPLYKRLTKLEAQVDEEAQAYKDMHEALTFLVTGKREDGKYDRHDAAGFIRIAEGALAKTEGE
ncbi:hypothetical protein LCGC14_0527580 [marine sediment metagenome]|uniref:Uncharacterized protein n=1 Tax=marine sediment metagenome TaxID=412755 RepID=A0A0F9SF27_9ZZZZ